MLAFSHWGKSSTRKSSFKFTLARQYNTYYESLARMLWSSGYTILFQTVPEKSRMATDEWLSGLVLSEARAHGRLVTDLWDHWAAWDDLPHWLSRWRARALTHTHRSPLSFRQFTLHDHSFEVEIKHTKRPPSGHCIILYTECSQIPNFPSNLNFLRN